MTLRQYLIENKITLAKFAALIGVTYPHVIMIRDGKRQPRLDLAMRIEDATGGAVTARELCRPQQAATT